MRTSSITRPSLALRILLLVLPVAALAPALPDRPHPLVVVVVVLCSALWGRTPDHTAGVVALATVALWWTVHDVLDWRLLVVSVLLVTAHVLATVLSYGPADLPVDPHLASIWVRRGLLTLVPLPITWLAVQSLDADRAPPWVWVSAALCVVVLVVAALRVTQPVDE